MLLKFFWILAVAWIAYRAILAGRNLLNLAMGRDGRPLPGPDGGPRTDRPPSAPPPPSKKSADVEDARWVDL